MANEFKVKNGLIVIGDLTTSGTITINGALAATQSWVTSQSYLTSASLSGYATQSYVTSAISALIDAAPAALDTLNELAAALGDDASFSTTVTNSIAGKVAKSGDTMTGSLTFASTADNVRIQKNGSFLNLRDPYNNIHLYNTGDGTYIDANVHFWRSQAGTHWVALNSTGLGIGTTSPNSVLDIRRDGGSSTNPIPLTSWYGGNGGGNLVAKLEYTADAGIFTIGYAGLASWDSIVLDGGNSNAGSSIALKNDAVTTVFLRSSSGNNYINSGNLGIGTSSPQDTLHINGTMRWGGGTTAPYVYSGIDSLGLYIEQVDNNTGKDKIRFQTRTNNVGSYTSFIIDANAQNFAFNRGDITLADGYRIWFRGSSASSATGSQSYIYSDGLNLKIKGDDNVQLLGDGGGVILHADYTGNVGIGTSSPAGKLSIQGDGTQYSNIVFKQSSAQEHLIYASLNYQYNLIGSGSPVWIWGQQGDSERMRLDNTGLGIGTTSPSYKLDVATGNDNAIRILNSLGSNNNGLALAVGSGTPWMDFNGSSFSIKYNPNPGSWNGGANNHFTILSGGNVGIGTTSPSAKFEIGAVGTDAVAAKLTQGFERVRFNTFDLLGYNDGHLWMIGNNAPSIVLGASWDWDQQVEFAYAPGTIGAASGLLDIGQTNKNSATYTHGVTRFFTNGSEAMRINSAGNIGIGTTSPGAKLHVAGNAWINRPSNKVDNAGATELGPRVEFNNSFASGQSGYVIFRYPTYNNFLISSDYDGNVGGAIPNIQFGKQSTVYLHMNSSNGNIGIGTTTPTNKLHVVSPDNEGIYMQGSSNGGHWFNFASANSNLWSMGAQPSLMGWYNRSDSSYKMVITDGGNVGIGTTSPGSKLSVLGNNDVFSVISQTGDISFATRLLAQYVGLFNNGANGHHLYVSSTQELGPAEFNLTKTWGGFLTFGASSDGTERTRTLYVNSNGYVGVGVNPTSGDKFEVAGSVRIHTGNNWDGIQIYAGGQDGYIRGIGDEVGLHIRSEYGNVLLADDRGLVGIGTTTPQVKLDVNGHVGVVGSNHIYFGHTTTNIGAWTTRTYASGSTHKFNAQTFIFNNEGYGSYEHMALTANGVNLRGKNTIDSTDSWLRLNQSGDYGSGVYTPGVMRADGGFNVSGNTVWHAGNDGSGSGLDADLLDGNHASVFATRQDGARYTTNYNSILSSGFFNGEATPTNAPNGYGQLIVAKGIDTGFQIAGGYSSNAMWFRGWGYGPEADGFYPWRRVWHDGDFTSTNVSNWNTAYGWGNHASQGYATTSYVTTQINNLINGAPGALDTLDELAAALGDDANFATTVTNSIAGKVSKSGDTMTSSAQQVLNVYHGAATGDFNDALFLKSIASGQQVQIGMATLDADGDHHRVSLRAYKGTQTLEGVFGIALRQPSAAHIQRFTLDYLGNVTIGGFLTESSSLKLKENVETSEGNLEKVVNLRPVTYNKIGSQTTELGLIAEEVAEVYPEFVQYDENGEPIGVNYSRLTAALIGAVKELTNQVQELNKKING